MAQLYLGIGRSVAVAPQVDHELHCHAALQITLALEHPFLFKTDTTNWTRTSAVAVNSNVPHEAKDFRGMCVSVHLLPERRRTAYLAHGFPDGGTVRFLDGTDIRHYVAFFRNLLDQDSLCSEVFRTTERLVEDLTGLVGLRGEIDNRLLDILERIQSSLATPIRLRELAHVACLSEGRFLHLFKEQLGITLRQYIVYQRVMRASAEIFRGASLTVAALNAGFSDSSHFTRKFMQLTGFRPSRLKQLRGSVRVHSCFSSRCVQGTADRTGAKSCTDCVVSRQTQSSRI